MSIYYYTLTPDTNGTNLIQYPDLPEGASVSNGEHDPAANAAEGLEAVLQLYIDARRLHVHNPQVDRLLNLSHSSKLEAIEAAFHDLGRRLYISVAP